MATIPTINGDTTYRIDYDFQNNKFRQYRQWIGPHTSIAIDYDSAIAASSCIYVSSATGSASGSGTSASALDTLLAGANACTSGCPYVLVTNTTLYAEDLSAINNVYFQGFYAASGCTPTYTLRTLGYTPSDANTIYVASTGSDAASGTSAAPKLTLDAADAAASGKNVVIKDSATYDITPRTMVASGWYAALGQAPTVTVNAASATYTLSPTTFNSSTTAYIDSCVLTNGNIVLAWASGAGSYCAYKIINATGGEIRAASALDTSSCTYISTCPNGDGFVIAYADAGPGKFRMFTAGGLGTGSLTTFESGATKYIDCCELSGGGFAIAWQDDDASDVGRFSIYDSSGSFVYDGRAASFEGGATTDISICELATTDIVIAFTDSGDSGKGKFRRFNSTGTAQDGGTPVEFANSAAYTSSTGLSDGTFVISYYKSIYVAFCIYTSSGVAVISDVTAGFATYTNVISLLNNDFIIMLGGLGFGKFIKYNSSGTQQGETVTFEDGDTKYISASILSDDSFFIFYQDDADSDYGKFIKNTSIYYNAITVSAAATINGITYDGEDQEYLRRMIDGTANITTKWSEFKNVTDAINPTVGSVVRTVGANLDIQNCLVHDNKQGVYSNSNTNTITNNLFYRNTSGYGACLTGTAASSGDITVEHNTFFQNATGLQMENNNGTNEIIKNNIFSENTTYDINAENAMTTTYSIVSESKCANVTASSGCTTANPLFENDGSYDEDDTDLTLKMRVLGDYSDSPAYMLADDAIDRDAGAWDVIVIGQAETYSTVTITKPVQGIDLDYEVVGARKSRAKSGKTRTGKDAHVEVVKITHDGITTANFLKLLDMVLADDSEVDIYWNPTSDPNTYFTYTLVYETVSGSAKNYRNNAHGKQDVKLVFERKLS